jgi:hypothetical protein
MILEGPVLTGPFFLSEWLGGSKTERGQNPVVSRPERDIRFRADAVGSEQGSRCCSRKGIFTLHHSALCFDDICRE